MFSSSFTHIFLQDFVNNVWKKNRLGLPKGLVGHRWGNPDQMFHGGQKKLQTEGKRGKCIFQQNSITSI